MRVVAGLLAATTIAAASPAAAFNARGHMIVAEVAYAHLTDKAKTKASELIRVNPDYAKLISGFESAPRAKQDQVAFVRAATWPDMIKSDSEYTDKDDTVSAATAAQNSGYSDKLRHRYWHYYDIAFSPDHTPTKEAETPNAKTQIAALRDAIGSASTSNGVKSYDLVWLLHLVGDAHQPLHATSRYTKTLANGDNGGNSETVCDRSCGALHAFWDGAFGTGSSVNTAITYADALPAADHTKAAIADEEVWFQESFAAAKKYAYAAPVKNTKGPFTLTKKYRADAARISNQRAELAGARLASLINDAFK
jgi:hypothetical protein